MTKDELKKMRLANLRRGREERKKKSEEAPKIEVPTPALETPPPLPPLAAPPVTPASPVGGVTGGAPLNAPGAATLEDDKLKKGLGLAFGSSLKGIENLLNGAFSQGGRIKYEIEKLDPAEEELWGTFALPVLKKHFPKFEESPEYALIFVSLAIVGGKIKVKREVLNAGNQNSNAPHP